MVVPVGSLQDRFDGVVGKKSEFKRGFDHMIKARAHKGGVRIGKMPKKLDSICCPQHRETKADTLKQQGQ
jgi:hypothetical protein